ncbi:head GIN domain-containing protein [Winogradskyella litorisediminis]|uniref:Head GIN domain-containing protein n=1 Tax=Winogradskyella litorisediminis TaxID=1156618 RepID=A0ABW3N4Q6_9FLAO
MKKIIYIIALLSVFTCDNADVPDCFQAAGEIIQVEYDLNGFDKITVLQRSQLIVSEGQFSVTLETGENLENDISVFVNANGRLIIDNENACNISRDYGITKVFVSAPNVTEIRNASGLEVLSVGVLSYPNLLLISEDLEEEEDAFNTNGDFRLDLDVQNLKIIQNNLSNFFLTGNVTNLDINFLFGDGRFEGRNLSVENTTLFHRGTNDIILNPQNSLTGSILSTGDVRITNTPTVLNVEELYTGRLIVE